MLVSSSWQFPKVHVNGTYLLVTLSTGIEIIQLILDFWRCEILVQTIYIGKERLENRLKKKGINDRSTSQ